MLPNAVAQSDERFGLPLRLWSAGSLSVGKLTSAGASETRFSTSGLSVGADAQVANGLKLGLALGMGSDTTDIGSSGSRNEATSYTATSYASWRFMPHSYFDVSFGYGTLRYGLRRWSADGGVMLQGNRSGDMFYGSMGVTELIKFSGWTISPYVRMDVAKISLAGYTETGSGLWALAYDPLNVTSLKGVVGGRAAYPIRMPWGTLTPTIRLDYRHAFSGGFTQGLNYADLAAAGYPGSAISELSTVRDTYVGGVGLRADIGQQLAVDLEYRASGGADYLGHSLRGSVRYQY